jgi:predicted nucleotidyltransferase
MLRKTAIDALIPKIRQQILAAILLRPDRDWYLTELARHLKLRPSSLQRDLAELVQVGLLRTERRGRLVLYSGNSDSPILRDLQNLLIKTVGLVDVVRDALAPFRENISFAFIHGSTAAGDVHALSDVDVIVIGAVRPAQLSKAFRPLQQQLGREVNHKYYSLAEFNAKRDASDHFLSNVLRKPKIMLIGDEHDLSKTSN